MKAGQEGELRSSRPRILIADNEPSQARQAELALREAGYDCAIFPEPQQALAALDSERAPIIVADPGAFAMSASEFLSQVRARAPEAVLILLVPTPAAPRAASAIRQGAFDYLTKPLNRDELASVVGRALEIGGLRRENSLLHEQLAAARMAAAFIAESPRSRELAAAIRRAAPARSSVLVEGASGTGKELVAHMLHHWSNRAHGPFIRIPFKSLAAGEREAMPGRAASSAGAFAMICAWAERAAGGTLLLDEIGEATPEFQAALLRFIGEAARARGPRADEADAAQVRLVATTNRNLASEVAANRFRADLYFELNVIRLVLPPLSERREDILPLARHFLATLAAETGRSFTLTAAAESAMLAYPWPGNVRELEKAIERAVVMGTGDRISAEALGLGPARPEAPEAERPAAPERKSTQGEEIEVRSATLIAAVEETTAGDGASAEPAPEAAPSEPSGAGMLTEGTLQDCLDRAATIRVKAAIAAAGGNRVAAAGALGSDRATLYRLMRRLGL